MHTRAPCTLPPARASPSLALGRFRPGLLVVRQESRAGSSSDPNRSRPSPAAEVSLGKRLISCMLHARMCAPPPRSQPLALTLRARLDAPLAPRCAACVLSIGPSHNPSDCVGCCLVEQAACRRPYFQEWRFPGVSAAVVKRSLANVDVHSRLLHAHRDGVTGFEPRSAEPPHRGGSTSSR